MELTRPIRLGTLWAVCFSALLMLGSPALSAQPVLVVGPAKVRFDSVAVGGNVTGSVLIRNEGTSTATISSVFPMLGKTTLSASPSSFLLAPSQNQVVTFTYSPAFAGDISDGFRFVSDAALRGSTAPSLIIPVSGRATGPRMTLTESRLSFRSLVIGSAVSDTLVIGNTGTETLNVLSFLTTSSTFVVNTAAPFDLAPGDTQFVRVTYQPTSRPAVSDTLTILTNNPGESLAFVGLDAAETPTTARTARLSLVRTGGSATPAADETVRIALFMVPLQDTIRGVEVFLEFDHTLFEPQGATGPFEHKGLTADVGFQINKIENPGTTNASAHFSVVFSQNKRSADTLVVIRLKALKQIQEKTTVRVVSEKPLRNSNYLTPENLSFGIPGTNAIELGNSSPVLKPFSMFTINEDSVLVIDLDAQAADGETPPADLTWWFEDTQGLFSAAVESVDGNQTAWITPPQDGFGFFDMLAIVSDAAGAADTTAMIFDVKPINDPPDVPVYMMPADSSAGLDPPVQLTWSGGDPEGDFVTYEVQTGTLITNLKTVARNLATPVYNAEGLGGSKTYFWRIVTVDAGGARTEGSIRRFTTAPDTTPPNFTVVPAASSITSVSAVVIWNTDETATGVVRIGLQPTVSDSASFDSFGSDVFLLLRHEVAVTGLHPSTAYFFTSKSRDLFGNTGFGPIGSFTTLPPEFRMGDFDGNYLIDFSDFLGFAEAFNTSSGETAFNERADFDSNLTVDFSDFLAFVDVFGTSLTKQIAN